MRLRGEQVPLDALLESPEPLALPAGEGALDAVRGCMGTLGKKVEETRTLIADRAADDMGSDCAMQ